MQVSDKLIITDVYISVKLKFRKEVYYMIINNSKLQIALATACMNPYDLCKVVNIQYQTYRRISAGNNCKPATVGKIAKALNVPVENLIDVESSD